MAFWKRWFKKQDPIVATDVGFSYKNQEVLRDLSMSIKKKEIVAIIGESGSGKSTLLKIVAGIIGAGYHGKIKIFGREKLFKKSKVGFVPQELSFIPDLSIKDNLKLFGLNYGVGESIALERGLKLLNLLKLSEDINKKPTELSGGQKVRLNIVLSFLHDPEILILDEPFVGLDFGNRRLLWHFIESMKKKGKSIILTSHLLTETQEHVDRLVILRKGKIFFSGQLDKLKSRLKVNFIYELRFSYLSKENLEKIRKYCSFKDIEVLDSYERYLMLGMNTTREQSYLIKFFEKLNLKYEEIGFREPNLDEVFLKS